MSGASHPPAPPVTRDVILDLLPLYAAGELSDDSRRLVEAHLATFPDLREVLQGIESTETLLGVAPDSMPFAPQAERDAFVRTRQRVHLTQRLFGVALACVLAPLSFYFRGGELKWIMIRDNPEAAWFFLGVGAVLWGTYGYMRWREGRGAGAL